MELLLNVEELEPLPSKESFNHNKPMGLLTSKYKTIVNSNFKESSKHTLFGKRQAIKRRFYITNCLAEVTVKLSLFLIIFLVMFS